MLYIKVCKFYKNPKPVDEETARFGPVACVLGDLRLSRSANFYLL